MKESEENPDSVSNFYKNLIAFRKDNDIIKNGVYINLNKTNKNLMIYKRQLGEKEIVVISNFTKKKQKLSKKFKQFETYKKVISNYSNNTNVLEPYETRALENV